MKSIHIDWSDLPFPLEDIDFTCPWCDGEGKLDWDTWLEEEAYFKGEGQTTMARHYGAIVYARILTEEGIVGSDYTAEEIAAVYFDLLRDEHEKDNVCENCTEGRLEPMMNYAYPVCGVEVTKETRKVAAGHGLFLFETDRLDDETEVWMSLMGGGMDLSPNIRAAYLELCGYIPLEWAEDFDPGYKLGSDEEHVAVAKECLEQVQYTVERLCRKAAAIKFFIDDPEGAKEAYRKRMDDFDAALNKARDIDDPMIRGLVAMQAFAKTMGDVLPPEENQDGRAT